MRPQTSDQQITYKEIFELPKRPQSGRLLNSYHFNNYKHQILQSAKSTRCIQPPAVQQSCINYVPNARNFGSICDYGFQGTSKQIQIQKFGKASSKINAFKTSSSNKQQSNKQSSQIRIIDSQNFNKKKPTSQFQTIIDDLLYIDPEQVNRKKTFKKIYKQPDQMILLIFKYPILISILFNRTIQIELIQQAKRQKALKHGQKLYIPFHQLKPLLTLTQQGLSEYLQKCNSIRFIQPQFHIDLSYEDQTLKLFLQNDFQQIITSDTPQLDPFQLSVGMYLFKVIPAHFEVYNQENSSFKTIDFTQFQLCEMFHSNFKYIDEDKVFQTAKCLDKKIQVVLTQFFDEKFNSSQKIVKKVAQIEDRYVTISFRPCWIEVYQKEIKQGSYFLNLVEMANLIEMVAHHHNIHTILENKVKVSYLDGVTRRSTRMKVEMDTEKDKQLGLIVNASIEQMLFSLEENGFFQQYDLECEEYEIAYMPPCVEIYDPSKVEKEIRSITQQELGQLMQQNYRFTLKIK